MSSNDLLPPEEEETSNSGRGSLAKNILIAHGPLSIYLWLVVLTVNSQTLPVQAMQHSMTQHSCTLKPAAEMIHVILNWTENYIFIELKAELKVKKLNFEEERKNYVLPLIYSSNITSYV